MDNNKRYKNFFETTYQEYNSNKQRKEHVE